MFLAARERNKRADQRSGTLHWSTRTAKATLHSTYDCASYRSNHRIVRDPLSSDTAAAAPFQNKALSKRYASGYPFSPRLQTAAD
jgi:hypothetical protein